MGFARRSILVCLVGTACLATVAVGQTIEPGAIEGRVLDVHGNGVAGVRLGAYVDGPVAGRLPTAVSAGDGSFRIASVQPGTYRMGSAKEEDGYPDTMWGGIADSRTEVPTVEVFAGHTTSDVNIHLGPPTGVLHGTVLDDHGRPMMSARLVVYPEDEPDLTVSTSLREGATFVLALPDRFYTLTIDAPGFEQWSSEIASEVPTHHVRLRVGETQQLVLHLRRSVMP